MSQVAKRYQGVRARQILNQLKVNVKPTEKQNIAAANASKFFLSVLIAHYSMIIFVFMHFTFDDFQQKMRGFF